MGLAESVRYERMEVQDIKKRIEPLEQIIKEIIEREEQRNNRKQKEPKQ